jgi:hypothetical protein
MDSSPRPSGQGAAIQIALGVLENAYLNHLRMPISTTNPLPLAHCETHCPTPAVVPCPHGDPGGFPEVIRIATYPAVYEAL